MAHGLRIRDQYGNIKLDVSDRVGRFLGMIFIDAFQAGSVVNNGFLTGTPFCTATMTGDSIATFPGDGLFPPAISFSGNVMSWTGPGAPHRLMMWVR
jgi:hypothetical protein